MDLEDVWSLREDDIYPRLFGASGRGIFTLAPSLFRERFGQTSIDPRWLFLCAFEFAPTTERPFWVYVTSGHSNSWDEHAGNDPSAPSGAGVEFLFATARRGDWAIRTLLDVLAFDLLLRAGYFPGEPPLGPGSKVALRAPINGDKACQIRSVLITQARDIASGFSLPSGAVRLLALTGITDAEAAYAETASTSLLVEALRAKGHHPVTDVRRPSLF